MNPELDFCDSAISRHKHLSFRGKTSPGKTVSSYKETTQGFRFLLSDPPRCRPYDTALPRNPASHASASRLLSRARAGVYTLAAEQASPEPNPLLLSLSRVLIADGGDLAGA